MTRAIAAKAGVAAAAAGTGGDDPVNAK